MSKKDYIFTSITILTSIGMCLFVFWLGFPGYFQTGDIYNSLAINTNHWHPVFIARFIECMYALFGKHSFYLFSLNIFCFYAGFAFFIIAIYIKTRTVIVYFLFLLAVLGNILLQNSIQYHILTFPMLLWLGCSMVFFQILVQSKNRYINILIKSTTLIVFFFALFWRHNAIISIYPLCAFFIYLYLKKSHIDNRLRYVLKFSFLMLMSAFFLVVFVKGHPYLLSNHLSKTTANHIFLHQIAGMVIPANDQFFIPQEWYEKNKKYQDVEEMYAKYPTVADPFNVGWEPYNSNRPFKRDGLYDLKLLWFKGILKYPSNYLKHISRYFQEMWYQNPGWIFDSNKIQEAPTHPWHINIASNFPTNERKITFSPMQKKIYNYFFKHKILLNHIVGIKTGFTLLFVSSCIWVFLLPFRTDMLFFTISTSLSTCCTAIMVCIFSPYPDPRYMSPVLVLALISSICFTTYLYLALIKNVGNFFKKVNKKLTMHSVKTA